MDRIANSIANAIAANNLPEASRILIACAFSISYSVRKAGEDFIDALRITDLDTAQVLDAETTQAIQATLQAA